MGEGGDGGWRRRGGRVTQETADGGAGRRDERGEGRRRRCRNRESGLGMGRDRAQRLTLTGYRIYMGWAFFSVRSVGPVKDRTGPTKFRAEICSPDRLIFLPG